MINKFTVTCYSWLVQCDNLGEKATILTKLRVMREDCVASPFVVRQARPE